MRTKHKLVPHRHGRGYCWAGGSVDVGEDPWCKNDIETIWESGEKSRRKQVIHVYKSISQKKTQSNVGLYH